MTGLQLEPSNDCGLDQAHQARPSTDGLRGKARSALGRRRRGFPRPGAVLQEQAREGFLLAAVDRVGVAGDQIADLQLIGRRDKGNGNLGSLSRFEQGSVGEKQGLAGQDEGRQGGCHHSRNGALARVRLRFGG